MTMLTATMFAATMHPGGFTLNVGAFEAFIDSDTPASVIVEITGSPKSATPLLFPFPPTMGWATMGVEIPAGTIQGDITLQLSSDGKRFRPDDPISPGYKTEGRLAQRVEVRSSIDIAPDVESSAILSVGDVQIFDQDRWIEAKIDQYNFDGRKVRILFGPRDGTLADYRVVAEAFGRDWSRADDGRATLRLQDLQFGIEREFQAREFAGTGGLEGDLALRGRLKPRLFGYRKHFTPVLIDVARRWWMYNDGAAQGVVNAYYGGEPLIFEGDFPDIISFGAAPVSEGAYVTCNALGILRDRPAGGIDAVFAIEAHGDNFGGYSALIGDLIAKVFRQIAGFDLTKYDAASLIAFNIGDGSYWFDGSQSVSIRQVVERLAADGGGRLSPGARFQAFSLRDPDSEQFDFEIKEGEIKSLRRDSRANKPVLDVSITWKPNDTIVAEADVLLPANNPTFKAYIQTAGEKTAPKPDGLVIFRHRDFIDRVELSTSLTDLNAVALLEDRYRKFFSKERYYFDLEILSRRALLYPIGSIVSITHRSSPFTNTKNALIVKVEANYDTLRTRLRVIV